MKARKTAAGPNSGRAPNRLVRCMERAITARVAARILRGGGMQIGAAGWAGNDATLLAIVQRQLCSLVGPVVGRSGEILEK